MNLPTAISRSELALLPQLLYVNHESSQSCTFSRQSLIIMRIELEAKTERIDVKRFTVII